jgi:hypothetical protein
MGRRRTTAALACGAALIATTAACGGDEPAPADVAPQGRAELLAACPAQAPSWTEQAGAKAAAPAADDPAYSRAVDVATRYLAGLPADQAGELRVDQAGRVVVVQVTRDADRVRRELGDRIGDAARVEVETVRWSKSELERATGTVARMPGLDLTSVGAGADGRVEVTVPDAAAIPETRAALAKALDPCMVRVTQEDRARTLPGAAVP